MGGTNSPTAGNLSIKKNVLLIRLLLKQQLSPLPPPPSFRCTEDHLWPSRCDWLKNLLPYFLVIIFSSYDLRVLIIRRPHLHLLLLLLLVNGIFFLFLFLLKFFFFFLTLEWNCQDFEEPTDLNVLIIISQIGLLQWFSIVLFFSLFLNCHWDFVCLEHVMFIMLHIKMPILNTKKEENYF